MEAGARSGWLWAGVLAAVVVVVAQSIHPPHGFDLAVYRMGAQSVLRGHAEAELYALRSHFGLAFTYPPLAAVLFAPLALVTLATDKLVVDVLLGLATAALWQVSLRAAGRRSGVLILLPLTLATLLVEPVWLDFQLGQVSLVLVLMVVADLGGVVPHRLRGVLTGLAAAIKLTPLIFLVLLALTRQWRALLLAAGTFAAAAAVGFVVLPRASWGFWTTYVHQTDRVGDAARIDDQSVRGVLIRLGVHAHGVGSDVVWVAAAGVLGAAAMAVAVLWWRRGERLLGVCLAALAGLFVSPISWYHHWCWIVPLVVALTRISRVAAGLAAVPFLLARRIAVAAGWKSSVHHWDALQQVVGNAYVWTAVLVVGYAGWRLWRDRTRRGGTWTPEREESALT